MKKLILVALSMMAFTAIADTRQLIVYKHVNTAAIESASLCEIHQGVENLLGNTRYLLICDGVTAIDLTATYSKAGHSAAQNKLKSVLKKHNFSAKNKNGGAIEYSRE